jgi:hypothetical protein
MTEIQMKRTRAVELVKQAARQAGLLDTDTDALVAYVSNPRVTRIARGTVDNIDCVCPAAGAGLWPKDDPNAPSEKVLTFAFVWDDLTDPEPVKPINAFLNPRPKVLVLS